MNSTTKVGQDAPPVVEDEKAAAKMQDIPINSPAIQARLPAHYRHNDFECQHGHRRDGGDGGICPYMFPSNLSFDPRQGHSEYDHSHDHEADTQKPCHRSPQVRRFLLPLLVMLSIVAGIFILNACLVSSGAIASFGHWDWKGIGEWRAGVTDVDDGLVGSDTGVVTVYPTHGIPRPNEGVTFPVQSPSFSSKAHGVDLPQIGSVGQIQETPLRSPLKREEGAFTKHKLYLIVIFLGAAEAHLRTPAVVHVTAVPVAVVSYAWNVSDAACAVKVYKNLEKIDDRLPIADSHRYPT
ncbi:hypothetical protein ONZ45_g14839 [Pleurotus djamor]|nr:hypothetical protein ONZ45_g14839 [Pleurotus djamor]